VLKEPLGGAHRDPQAMADALKDALLRHLNDLQSKPLEQMMMAREQRLRGYGVYSVA
jgi:acetyl-CoA carboxylase carboxyl transferase subunit alpha